MTDSKVKEDDDRLNIADRCATNIQYFFFMKSFYPIFCELIKGQII